MKNCKSLYQVRESALKWRLLAIIFVSLSMFFPVNGLAQEDVQIPQEILDEIQQSGTAHIIITLDVADSNAFCGMGKNDSGFQD